MIEPGAEVTLESTLNKRPAADAEIELDGQTVGFTDDDGTAEVTLPNEEKEVILKSHIQNLSDTLRFDIGTDSLALTPTPSKPDVGEDVTVEAKFNGEPVADIQIEKNGENVGKTNQEGKVTVSATEPPEMSISGEVDGVEDEVTVTVLGSGGTYPVDTDLPSDEVDKHRFEYEQWLTSGDEYSSSEVLRQGAVAVLEDWHDPTRLANPNASATGVSGIYYARGSETPVSIQSVNERKGLDIELPFGTEHNDVYEPLLWCGISSNDQLPQEDRYELNYDLLRGWTDDKVAEFRSEMRVAVEDCLPDDWTIEEFIIVAQYLLMNGGHGATDLSRDLVLTEYKSDKSYCHPIAEHFSKTHPFREAYVNLTKSSNLPHALAEGFFKLKEDFVDDQRLSQAYDTVESNLEAYVTEAMYIDSDGLPDAYRVGTTRSNATTKLAPLLKRVSEYAQELSALGPDDAVDIKEAITEAEEWLDASHTASDLEENYIRLYNAVGTLDVNLMDRWETQKENLENISNSSLAEFRDDIASLRTIESKTGPEFVALLHQFEKSRENSLEWDIYSAIGEMIQVARDAEVRDTDGNLEAEVRNSKEMASVLERRSDIANIIGGEN
jgi:hypothetical protein